MIMNNKSRLLCMANNIILSFLKKKNLLYPQIESLTVGHTRERERN
jgi:hypothetical protein